MSGHSRGHLTPFYCAVNGKIRHCPHAIYFRRSRGPACFRPAGHSGVKSYPECQEGQDVDRRPKWAMWYVGGGCKVTEETSKGETQ